MSALEIVDRFASPIVSILLLASLPVALVGFLVPGL
jgi:hypothetical protein